MIITLGYWCFAIKSDLGRVADQLIIEARLRNLLTRPRGTN